MKIVCGMAAHNEDWVIGYTARAALMWCDELIVLNHCSQDNIQQILENIQQESFFGSLQIIHESDPVFHSIKFYERLATAAQDSGATHIVLLDADEALSGNLLNRIRKDVDALPANATFELPWLRLRGALTVLELSGARTGFAFKSSNSLRYPQTSEHEYDIHLSRLPIGTELQPSPDTDGALMHLQYLDERRLRAKELLWKMKEVLRWPNRVHISYINSLYDSALSAHNPTKTTPDAWLASYKHLERYINVDAESWAEKEAKQLWEDNPGKFTGLNTLGIV